MLRTVKRDDGIVNDLDDDVKLLQTNLNRKGYNLAADGKFGSLTELAVKDFQIKNGLSPTGIADSITIEKLTGIKEYKMSPDLEKDYIEFKKYESILNIVITNTPYVDMPLVFGLGSRESNWGRSLVNGWGDHGNAAGIFQVDKRWHGAHINSGDCWDFTKHATYALKLLNSNISYYITKYPNDDKKLNTLRGICAYNAGCGGVDNSIKRGGTPDSATTGANYGTDVLNRAKQFELKCSAIA